MLLWEFTDVGHLQTKPGENPSPNPYDRFKISLNSFILLNKLQLYNLSDNRSDKREVEVYQDLPHHR